MGYSLNSTQISCWLSYWSSKSSIQVVKCSTQTPMVVCVLVRYDKFYVLCELPPITLHAIMYTQLTISCSCFRVALKAMSLLMLYFTFHLPHSVAWLTNILRRNSPHPQIKSTMILHVRNAWWTWLLLLLRQAMESERRRCACVTQRTRWEVTVAALCWMRMAVSWLSISIGNAWAL